MKSDSKFFKNSNSMPVDRFFQNVLYDKKNGYYNTKNPLGAKGDFITAPKISNLFSEMIAVWMVSIWEIFGKPKNLNIIELGPGDGSFIKVLLQVSKRFPEFDIAKKIYLFEKSKFLKQKQKRNINNKNIVWVKNFDNIKKGPVIFFGNEFFDAIPIKQFKRERKILFEKYYTFQRNFEIKETFKKASKQDIKMINSYKILKGLNFIEFPKIGINELNKIVKKILSLNGCILIIDYGYIKPNNLDTIQSVIKHKKNHIMKNLGKADITSHVNFSLLKEFFLKNSLIVNKTITQKDFLENMGIKNRAEIISKKMSFREKSDLYLRLKRLLSPKLMGNLFKVFLAHNLKETNYHRFK